MKVKPASFGDWRRWAKELLPEVIFGHVDGVAGTGISDERQKEALRTAVIPPDVFSHVPKENVKTSTTIQGRRAPSPLMIAPTGATRLLLPDDNGNPGGELSIVRALESMSAPGASIPYTMSTLTTTSPEDIAKAGPNVDKWFQLYMVNDETNEKWIERMLNARFRVLVVTLDLPTLNHRRNDVRNGFTTPPTPPDKIPPNEAAYWHALGATPPIEYALFPGFKGPVRELTKTFKAGVTLKEFESLVELWPGPVVAKGILYRQHAKQAADAGASAVYLSGHGGRAADHGPAPIHQLPEIVAEVSGYPGLEVYIDGRMNNGPNIVTALANGARACLLGRGPLWALAADGQSGVRDYLGYLQNELVCQMQLAGVTDVGHLRPEHAYIPGVESPMTKSSMTESPMRL